MSSNPLRHGQSIHRPFAAAALVAVGLLSAATTVVAQEPSRLDFDAETVAVGDSVRFTFTVDPALSGQRVKLHSGSNLGPTQMGEFLVPVGGVVRRRASFDVTAPSMSFDFPVASGLSGKTYLLAFTTSINEVVTSVSNAVSVQFGDTSATFKQVPVPEGYGWVPGDMGAEHNFLSVAFADENRGFAGGPASTLWVTSDGGRTWGPQVIDTALVATVRDVEFADAQHGWAIGSFFSGIVWMTVDGGDVWARRSVNIVPFAIDFVDAQTGWVAGMPSPFGGGGPIAKTTDGGTTWVMQARDVQEELRSVKFADRNHGIAAGRNGLVLMTSDGGATWTRKTLPVGYRDSYLMAADTVMGGDLATVAGYDSVVLRTTDGGASWEPLRVPADRTFLSVAFTSALRGWLVGNRGSILWTFDGGDTWLPFDANGESVNETFNKVYALDRDSAWAVGNGGQVRAFTIVENE